MNTAKPNGAVAIGSSARSAKWLLPLGWAVLAAVNTACGDTTSASGDADASTESEKPRKHPTRSPEAGVTSDGSDETTDEGDLPNPLSPPVPSLQPTPTLNPNLMPPVPSVSPTSVFTAPTSTSTPSASTGSGGAEGGSGGSGSGGSGGGSVTPIDPNTGGFGPMLPSSQDVPAPEGCTGSVTPYQGSCDAELACDDGSRYQAGCSLGQDLWACYCANNAVDTVLVSASDSLTACSAILGACYSGKLPGEPTEECELTTGSAENTSCSLGETCSLNTELESGAILTQESGREVYCQTTDESDSDAPWSCGCYDAGQNTIALQVQPEASSFDTCDIARSACHHPEQLVSEGPPVCTPGSESFTVTSCSNSAQCTANAQVGTSIIGLTTQIYTACSAGDDGWTCECTNANSGAMEYVSLAEGDSPAETCRVASTQCALAVLPGGEPVEVDGGAPVTDPDTETATETTTETATEPNDGSSVETLVPSDAGATSN